MEPKDCRDLKELMQLWKNKEQIPISYNVKKEKKSGIINHKGNVFISDGMVNGQVWENVPLRIVFLLKEAYGGEKDWSLTEGLDKMPVENDFSAGVNASNSESYSAIWRRVAEWSRAILETTKERIPKYVPAAGRDMMTRELLRKIAIVNLKKSGGVSNSDYEEIRAYALSDAEEIRKELEILSPDVIVCGYTFGILNELYGNPICKKEEYNDNWYYFTNVICEKETVILDFYHPANQYPALFNYYALAGIYQQALLEKET